MAYEWRCADCGQAWPEEGRGRYVLTAGQHMKRQGHHPLGLIDTETGEVLVAGSINRNAAERLGIIERPDRRRKAKQTEPPDADTIPLDSETDPHDAPKSAWRPAQPLAGNDPALTGAVKTTRQSVESLGPGDPKGQVVGFEVQWPLWALSFFDLLRSEFLDDQDQPYTWSTKDFVRFVLDVYRHGCRNLVRQVVARRYATASAAERTKLAAAMISTVENIRAADFLRLMAHEVEAHDPTWAALLRVKAQQEGA